MNHDMRLFSLLLNGSFRLLNAELNSKRHTECIYKEADALPQTDRWELKKLQQPWFC